MKDRKAYYIEYNKKNAEKRRAYVKKWKEENPDYHNEYMRKYREKNREQLREYMKEWRLANKDKVNAYQSNWRAKKKAANPEKPATMKKSRLVKATAEIKVERESYWAQIKAKFMGYRAALKGGDAA